MNAIDRPDNDDSSSASGKIGVVVMAYGTPAVPEDVEAYYTHIRRGRPPSDEQLANLRARYDALGGTSTLAQRTRDQISRIRDSLERSAPGRFWVVLGQKHASPFIEDGVAALVEGGVDQIIGLVLAPHYSAFSVGQYLTRAGEAAEAAGIDFTGIERWHDLPAYRDFLTTAVQDGLTGLPAGSEVVFTAHSLPERVMAGDPYPDELTTSAQAVAEAADLDPWSIAWQSAGATPEPWRGPDVLEVIREKAADGHTKGLLVCAQGFVADHLEVAYDLDEEAWRLANDLGLPFARTRVLNDDRKVMAALADLVAHTANPQ